MSNIEEIWKGIPLNPELKISNKGVLFNIATKVVIPQRLAPNGYLHASRLKVIGYGNGYTPAAIHRLMAWAFYGVLTNRKTVHCHHKDGNKLNNDIDNLELVTPSQNVRHAYNAGLNPGGYAYCRETEHYKKWWRLTH